MPFSCVIPLQLANAFSVTVIFPFLPFMVQFLLPELKEDKESIGGPGKCAHTCSLISTARVEAPEVVTKRVAIKTHGVRQACVRSHI